MLCKMQPTIASLHRTHCHSISRSVAFTIIIFYLVFCVLLLLLLFLLFIFLGSYRVTILHVLTFYLNDVTAFIHCFAVVQSQTHENFQCHLMITSMRCFSMYLQYTVVVFNKTHHNNNNNNTKAKTLPNNINIIST